MWCNNLIKSIALVVVCCTSFALAEDYSLTVDYVGANLYYKVGNGNCTNAGKKTNSSFSFSFTANPEAQIAFYSDRNCKNSNRVGTARKLNEIFEPGETSASIDAVPKSSSSSAISSSSSVKESGKDPVKPESSSSTQGGGTKPTAGKTIIRFLTPWSNTSAILYLNGDSAAVMTKVDKYCGWFQASIAKPAGEFYVTFKQTVGNKYYGMEGINDGIISAENEISLDSIAALGDTIWVRSYKADAPDLHIKYPGVLGDCPTKKIPVMMLDWYDGSTKEGRNGYEQRDVPRYGTGTSADFGSDGCNSKQPMTGMVEIELGANGLPQRKTKDFPAECTNSTHLDNWFIPEIIGEDAAGKKYTNAICRDLELTMTDDGLWLGQKNDNSPEKGFFLLDDFRYLDTTKTVENVYYDSARAFDGSYHNFGMTMMFQAKFEYVKGQEFEFNGDDDVWVYINNRLVIDIGGQHGKVARAVNLDTLGLVEGDTYPFHIFYAERKVTQSNFMMRTSIDLQTDASMLLSMITESGIKNYEVWQINKKDALSCDFSASAKTTTDTTGGASTFRLTGGNLDEPMELGVGKHFEGGIIITSDSTFSIDSAAIVENYTLAPGHYFLEITLKSDPSQTTTIEITVPSYAIPSVAFADSSWKIIGKEVDGDTLQIGKWSYEIYKVNITFFEEWAQVSTYNRKITLSVSDPLIDIIDENGNSISKVTLDSNAHATFYIRANGEVTGATLLAQGSAAAGSFWKNLNFQEPPIPRVAISKIFDRNGDGRGDSLYIKFDKKLDAQNILDSLQFTFGETFKVMDSRNFKVLESGTEVVVLADGSCKADDKCGFGSRQFTGGETSIYTGNIGTWFTYIENKKSYNFKITNDPVEDGIGPIIIKAVKEKMSDGNRQLTLTFSEAINDSTRKFYTEMFEYICIRNGESAKPEKAVQQGGSDNIMTLIFGSSTEDAVYPDDGDQIRFTPGSVNVAMDLNGNTPHEDNPWVTITGDQELSNESPGLITVSPDNPIIANDKTTQPILITDPKQNAQAIGDSLGVQGNLIDFDISKIMIEKTMEEIEALDTYIAKLTGAGKDDTVYNVTEMTEDEALKQLFVDIATDVVGEAYGITPEVIDSIKSGAITVENFKTQIKDKDVIASIGDLVQKNIEESRDTTITVIPATVTSYDDIFNQIANGEISEKELIEAGVSQDVIDAIKDGTLTPSNIEDYRSGSESLVSADAVKMHYRTRYYSHLGGYVGGTSGSINCSDSDVYGEGGCLNSKGKIFLAWNMRADDGRLVATGIYIARLELKVEVNGKNIIDQIRDKLWGVRRGQTVGFDLGN